MDIEKQKKIGKHFGEVGNTGLQRSAGYVDEEFLAALKGEQGKKVYRQMSDNDPTIGAVLFIARHLINSVHWTVEAASDKPADKKVAEFIEECRNDMNITWKDFIDEILTMLIYGYSVNEIVYKRRKGKRRGSVTLSSNYSDNKIGWAKLAIRSQATIERWKFDEYGEVLGVYQRKVPSYEEVYIPREKFLHFTTESRYNNPEGRSLLRNVYRPWYYKKNIEEIEGIGIERDLAGLPILQPPEDLDIWDPDDEDMQNLRKTGEQLVQNIRRDAAEGILLPFGWDLELLSTGSNRQFDTNKIINRYDQRIAMTLLGDLLLLGAEGDGSFALADVKKSLLAAALESILQRVVEVLNRDAIPRLVDLNVFPRMSKGKYPKFVVSEIETPSIEELGIYLNRLSAAGMQLFPDERLENVLRTMASLPEKKIDPGFELQPYVQDEDTMNEGNVAQTANVPQKGAGDPEEGASDHPNNSGGKRKLTFDDDKFKKKQARRKELYG